MDDSSGMGATSVPCQPVQGTWQTWFSVRAGQKQHLETATYPVALPKRLNINTTFHPQIPEPSWPGRGYRIPCDHADSFLPRPYREVFFVLLVGFVVGFLGEAIESLATLPTRFCLALTGRASLCSS